MWSTNSAVVEFIGNNWVVLSFTIGFLKILAKRSETTLDDSILSYLGKSLSGFRREKKPAPKK